MTRVFAGHRRPSPSAFCEANDRPDGPSSRRDDGAASGRSDTSESGFTLIEALSAYSGYLLFLPVVLGLIAYAVQDTADSHVAGQIKGYANAAQLNIKGNTPSLLASTAGGPQVITLGQLQAAGNLFGSATNKTDVGQTLSVVVNQPIANALQSVVVACGGGALTPRRARTIAGRISGQSGFFTSATNLQLTNGSSLNFTPYLSTGVTPATNCIGVVIYFANGVLIPDYLSRVQVPGSPTANQMFTTLDMNSFPIANAADVALVNIGKTANQGTYSIQELNPGAIVTKPTCPSGLTQEIHVNDEYVVEPNGEFWSAKEPFAIDNGNGTWTIGLVLRTINGNETLGPNDAILQVATKCN